MTLATDPRALPELLKVAKALQLDGHDYGLYLDLSNFAEIENIMAQSELGFEQIYSTIPLDLSGDENELEVEQSTITIDGPDGHQVRTYLFRRKDAPTGPLRAVVYIHGGGMKILHTTLPPHVRCCKSIALEGVISILVDYRNAYTPKKSKTPFPPV